MKVDELYDLLIDLGYEFRLIDGQIDMKPSVLTKDSIMYEQYLQAQLYLENNVMDSGFTTKIKTERRKELASYIKTMSTFSDEASEVLIKRFYDKIEHDFLWKGNELLCIEIKYPELFKEYNVHISKIDIAVFERDMLLLYEALRKFYKYLEKIFLVSNTNKLQQEGEENNPFKEETDNAKTIRDTYKKSGQSGNGNVYKTPRKDWLL